MNLELTCPRPQIDAAAAQFATPLQWRHPTSLTHKVKYACLQLKAGALGCLSLGLRFSPPME